eukprot:TRINITY_DN28939_c0_g1_i1.p1 TRINITY_DN28939_c0_g1~~TRINITY_DN28939_c0_g1_i1.p1  ORF type:complete len:376 (-),score=32.69 TRINITY_DN28939_c0_g1_i1:6-1109(-)
MPIFFPLPHVIAAVFVLFTQCCYGIQELCHSGTVTRCPKPVHRSTLPQNCTSFHGCPSDVDREETLRALRTNPRNISVACGFGRPTDLDLVRDEFANRSECVLVVVTAIFNRYDYLANPMAKLSHDDLASVCFVALVDEITAAQPFLTQPRNETVWDIRVLRRLPFPECPHCNARVHKFLTESLFPLARYSIAHDGKIRLAQPPWDFVRQYMRSPHNASCSGTFSVLQHPSGRTSQQEFEMELARRRYDTDNMQRQWAAYKRMPPPTRKCSVQHLIDSALIVRRHGNSCFQLLSCLWMNEALAHYSHREQLSFGYVCDWLQLADELSFYPLEAPFIMWPHVHDMRSRAFRRKRPKVLYPLYCPRLSY